jgi:hypothetical protein
MDLVGKMLPALRAADVVGFAVQDSSLVFIEEYVGVSAPLVTQAMRVLEALKPSAADLAVLHSVEIACWAPLTRYQHAESLVARGFGDEVVESAMKLGLGAGINHTVASAELNERVIDNPNVWGSASTGVDVATFLPLGLSRPTPGALTAATTARSRRRRPRRRPRRPGPRFQTGVCRVCRGARGLRRCLGGRRLGTLECVEHRRRRFHRTRVDIHHSVRRCPHASHRDHLALVLLTPDGSHRRLALRHTPTTELSGQPITVAREHRAAANRTAPVPSP